MDPPLILSHTPNTPYLSATPAVAAAASLSSAPSDSSSSSEIRRPDHSSPHHRHAHTTPAVASASGEQHPAAVDSARIIFPESSGAESATAAASPAATNLPAAAASSPSAATATAVPSSSSVPVAAGSSLPAVGVTAGSSSLPSSAAVAGSAMGLSSASAAPAGAADAAASANSVAAISVAAPPAQPSASSEPPNDTAAAPPSRFPPGMSARERMAARMAASKQGAFAVAKTAYDNACKAGLGPREAQLAADAAVAHAAQKGGTDPALPPPITPMPPPPDDGHPHSGGSASIAQLPNAVPTSLSLSTRSVSSTSLSLSSACSSPAAAALGTRADSSGGSPLPPPHPTHAAAPTSAASSSTSAHSSLASSPSSASAASAVAAPQPSSMLWSRSEAEWALRDQEFMSSMCWGVASAQGERAHMEDEHRIIQHFDKLVQLCVPPQPAAHTESNAGAASSSSSSSATAAPTHSPALRSSASVSSPPLSSLAPAPAIPAVPQSFFGVYDGHGGKEAAEFVRDHLHVNVAKRLASIPQATAGMRSPGSLTRSFAAAASGVPAPPPPPMDVGEAMKLGTADTESALLRESLNRSSTAGAVVAFTIFSGMQLYVAHAGDSRAVLCRDGRAMDLTQDHKPGLESEQSRVRSLGGHIVDGCVNGEIAVSRALGDVNLQTGNKMLGLSAEVQLSKFYLADEDEFVILACDGLWDVMNSANAVAYVRHCLLQHNDIQRAASELVAQALRQHTTDNVSVILIGFLRTLQHPQEEDGETRVIVPRPAAPRGAGGRREPRVQVPPRPARLQLRGHLHSAILNALSKAGEPTPKAQPNDQDEETTEKKENPKERSEDG